MPKRYADSAAHTFRKYDQLKVVVKSLLFENDAAYKLIDHLETVIVEQDSAANIDQAIIEVQEGERKKQRNTIRILGAVVGVELLLLILILL